MATAIQRSALLNRQSFLIDQNVTWLRQAILVLDRMDDRTYLESPPSLAPHRVGGHLRHVLEFYECFLDGLESSHIDYDARKRDARIETCRAAALDKTRSIIQPLERAPQRRGAAIVGGRLADATAAGLAVSFATSSV